MWTLSKVKTSLTVVGYPNLVVIKHNGSTFYHSFENDSFGRPIYIEKSKFREPAKVGQQMGVKNTANLCFLFGRD